MELVITEKRLRFADQVVQESQQSQLTNPPQLTNLPQLTNPSQLTNLPLPTNPPQLTNPPPPAPAPQHRQIQNTQKSKITQRQHPRISPNRFKMF